VGKELPVRKNIRLAHYDYSSAGYYDVTICTEGMRKLFGKVVDGKMQPNEFGIIAETELLNIPSHYANVKVDKYVIMPNHVHAIVVIVGALLAAPEISKENVGRASASPTLGNIMRGYKAGVSRKLRFYCWQRGYYEHIIRDEKDYLRRWQYIDNNPAKWAEDEYYTE